MPFQGSAVTPEEKVEFDAAFTPQSICLGSTVEYALTGLVT